MKIYTADEIRNVEEIENDTGTRFIRLMENAGAACAKQIESYIMENYSDYLKTGSAFSVCVVCGKGKNGGDGFVIARKLIERGYAVKVILALGAAEAPDAVEMYTKAVASGVMCIRHDREQPLAEKIINEADVLVDCIFGIGFHGVPSEECAKIFELVNTAPGRVISVDVPSGVNTDDGSVSGACIRANVTLAISVLKPCHILLPSRTFCGATTVLDIGISETALSSVSPKLITYENDELHAVLPMRNELSHKNDFGHVLCICGSKCMPGAARLAASAALYTGAGLVTVAFPEAAYEAFTSLPSEVMLLPLDSTEDGTISRLALPKLIEKLEKVTTVVIGCGLSQNEDITRVVREVIHVAKCNIVIDADALNAISANPEVLRETTADIVITPHPGEMSRLSGISVPKIIDNMQEVAFEFAEKYGVTVLLKGPVTIVASLSTNQRYLNPTGNAGLAKGGSGDVLSGIIGALLAQGLEPFTATCTAAYIHGMAADIAASTYSQNGMVASDLFDAIRTLYKGFDR